MYKKDDIIKILGCLEHPDYVFNETGVVKGKEEDATSSPIGVSLTKPSSCGCDYFFNSEVELFFEQSYPLQEIIDELKKYKCGDHIKIIKMLEDYAKS
jgi:hypothetical protein